MKVVQQLNFKLCVCRAALIWSMATNFGTCRNVKCASETLCAKAHRQRQSECRADWILFYEIKQSAVIIYHSYHEARTHTHTRTYTYYRDDNVVGCPSQSTSTIFISRIIITISTTTMVRKYLRGPMFLCYSDHILSSGTSLGEIRKPKFELNYTENCFEHGWGWCISGKLIIEHSMSNSWDVVWIWLIVDGGGWWW